MKLSPVKRFSYGIPLILLCLAFTVYMSFWSTNTTSIYIYDTAAAAAAAAAASDGRKSFSPYRTGGTLGVKEDAFSGLLCDNWLTNKNLTLFKSIREFLSDKQVISRNKNCHSNFNTINQSVGVVNNKERKCFRRNFVDRKWMKTYCKETCKNSGLTCRDFFLQYHRKMTSRSSLEVTISPQWPLCIEVRVNLS